MSFDPSFQTNTIQGKDDDKLDPGHESTQPLRGAALPIHQQLLNWNGDQGNPLLAALLSQTKQLGVLAERLEALARFDNTLLEKFLDFRQQVLRRQDHALNSTLELETAVVALLKGDRAAAEQIEKRNQYRRLVKQIREVVRSSVPADATVLVVSKGDEDLAILDERRTWHFPQDRSGGYAGFNPADTGPLIIHLEALRLKGAQYLLFPSTAFWWLDHYAGLRNHLDRRHRLLVNKECCLIYSLCEAPALGEYRLARDLVRIIDEYANRFEKEPAILDWNTGLDLAALLSQYNVFLPEMDANGGLPYLAHTVDIVVVDSRDAAALAEARRAADGALVTLSVEGGGTPAASLHVEWLRAAQAAPLATASIIIPVYNQCALTEACLGALQENFPPHVGGEIIVVDDCSTDDTLSRLAWWADKEPRLKVVRNTANSGFVSSVNNGLAVATGEIVVLLNNDTLPLQGWLEPLLKIFRDHVDAGVVGGKLVYPDGKLQEAGGAIFRTVRGQTLAEGITMWTGLSTTMSAKWTM